MTAAGHGDGFSQKFEVEKIAGETGLAGWPRGWAAYLMTRRQLA